MTKDNIQDSILEFQGVSSVVANKEKFKVKLGIGQEAYSTLRMANSAQNLWGIAGAGKAGAGFAATSSTIAGLFAPAAPTGFAGVLSAIGLGTAAAPAAAPVAVVVAAAVISSGAFFGVSRLYQSFYGSRVEEIPKFLNTGIDLLASSLYDLLGSLAFKIASIDGMIDPSERTVISEYFIEEWGYDRAYIEAASSVLEAGIQKSTLVEMATQLAIFVKNNPDCNFGALQKELHDLLTEIAEADGKVDEREEMAIERINNAVAKHDSFFASAERTVSESAALAGAVMSNSAEALSKSFASLTGKFRKQL